MKKTLLSAILLVTLTIVPTVSADDGVTERVECTTGSYGQQTCITKKIECTTGAYGQQNCHPVEEISKVLGAKTPHEVVNSGIEDIVPLAGFATFSLSAIGLGLSLRNQAI